MKSNSRKEDLKDADIVDTLLRLASKNLESRIKTLEEEIPNRERLRDELLGIIGTQHLKLEEKVWHMRYARPNNGLWEKLKEHELELRRLEQLKIREEITSAEDISIMREKLQKTQEEFETEGMKLKLIGAESEKEKPQYEYGKGSASMRRDRQNSTL